MNSSLIEKNILIAPFFVMLFIFFVPISVSIKSIFLGISLFTIVITPFYRPYLCIAFNSLWSKAALVFFLYVVLASFWSEAPLSMRLSTIEKYSKLIYLPLLAVVFMFSRTRKWAFNSYFAAILITCLLSFLKYKNLILINKIEDSGEIFYNHIATSFMVALGVYWATVLYLQTSEQFWQRAYCLLVMVIGTYQIFFLNTGRTGYFIYGILMIFLMLQKLDVKKAFIGIVLFGTIIGGAYMLSPLMQNGVNSLVNDVKLLHHHERNTSLGLRMQFHNYARTLFKEHPIIGIGTGNFKYRYAQEQPIPAWGPRLNDPHSQYWLILTEQGFIGIILFITFLSTLLVTAFKLKENKFTLLGVLIAFGVGAFSDSIFCYSPVGTLLIIFSALACGELLGRNIYKETEESKLQSSVIVDFVAKTS